MFCRQMCVKIIDNTQVTIQRYVCFNLVVHRLSFQKNIGFISKISMQTDENWQRMPKNREHLLFWREKFLVTPTLNSKYMSCLPNATLRNDGNVPGISL